VSPWLTALMKPQAAVGEGITVEVLAGADGETETAEVVVGAVEVVIVGVADGAATHTLWPGNTSAHAKPGFHVKKSLSEIPWSLSIL
jgi:hypothetical protein